MRRDLGRILALIILAIAAAGASPARADCTLAGSAVCDGDACGGETRPAGTIQYIADQLVMQYCDGTDWIAMNVPGSGSGGCTNPAKAEGTIIYNADHRVMQACVGNVWEAMGPVGGGDEWLQVSAGSSHSCGIKKNGRLYCWGSNGRGQLGDNTTTDKSLPSPVLDPGPWTAVSANIGVTCAIKADQTLWCWGNNSYGQTAQNTSSGDTLVPTQVSGGGSWQSVIVGSNTNSASCGIKTAQTLWCWGSNYFGATGQNTTAGATLVPTQVTGGGAWLKVGAGNVATCGIKADNTLWCWGGNLSGATGLNTATGNTLIPTQVNGGGSWKDISLGNASCGIKADDSLWCWGSNASGATGLNTASGNTLVPTQVSGGGAWSSVAVGFGVACGVRTNGTLWCWGPNTNGATGLNTFSGNTLVPTQVAFGGQWAAADPGFYHTCGITLDGGTWCWGSTQFGGLLGNTETNIVSVPTSSFPDISWNVVFGGSMYNCGIKDDESLVCWGTNSGGRFGDGTNNNSSVPVPVSGGGSWKDVQAADFHTCGIKSDDTLWCWGYNWSGSLGDGTYDDSNVPVQVFGGGAWQSVAPNLGDYPATCGIKLDNTLWCWGENQSGQTGLGTSAGEATAPTQVSGGGNWKSVSMGDRDACGIKADDTLWCWGGGTLVPTLLDSDAWRMVVKADGYACGINTDNTLWCWGGNMSGATGLNTDVGSTATPTEVFGGGNWIDVTVSYWSTCGIRADKTAWCWGRNEYGSLGNSAIAVDSDSYVTVPTATSGGSSLVSIDGRTSSAWQPVHFCALTTSKRLICWGDNSVNQSSQQQIAFATGVQPWCDDPTRAPGSLVFNSAGNVMQYCDGAGWVQIGR